MAALQDVVDSHPGLMFLQDAPEFHSRYVQTVIFLLQLATRGCVGFALCVCVCVCLGAKN